MASWNGKQQKTLPNDSLQEEWTNFNTPTATPRTNKGSCGFPLLALLCICLVWLAKVMHA